MKIILATIATRRPSPAEPTSLLLKHYLARAAKYTPCTHEVFPTEPAFFTHLEQSRTRTKPSLFLFDSRGRQLSSPELAVELDRARSAGTQNLVLAIGPADGWSDAARQRATLLVAFGRITLPHELAAIVAAEQLYRALTILAGHPYHSGH